MDNKKEKIYFKMLLVVEEELKKEGYIVEDLTQSQEADAILLDGDKVITEHELLDVWLETYQNYIDSIE